MQSEPVTPSPAPAAAAPPPDNQKKAVDERPHRNRRALRIAIIAVPLLLIALAVYYFVWVRPYESTDDAFIDGHAIQISPQVYGRVLKVFIDDNQFVKTGDPLVQIDPRDYDAALAQAQANLAAAQSHLAESRQQVIVSQ